MNRAMTEARPGMSDSDKRDAEIIAGLRDVHERLGAVMTAQVNTDKKVDAANASLASLRVEVADHAREDRSHFVTLESRMGDLEEARDLLHDEVSGLTDNEKLEARDRATRKELEAKQEADARERKAEERAKLAAKEASFRTLIIGIIVAVAGVAAGAMAQHLAFK